MKTRLAATVPVAPPRRAVACAPCIPAVNLPGCKAQRLMALSLPFCRHFTGLFPAAGLSGGLR
ncbi:TPA: hypothetical protein RU593_004743 [Salmonella enterica]|nr:hypothetical protein [Salmonella enterica]